MDIANQFSLQGKIALVTGGAGGIGREMARGFAAAGAKVWIADIDESGGVSAAAEIKGQFFKTDLSQSNDIQALAQAILTGEPRLDVLVNNAAIEIIMPFEKMDMAIFDRTWTINVRAPVELTHALLPALRKSDGASIINLTSVHAAIPYPNNTAYSMTKAALVMFTQTIAVELAPQGIRVNNLSPGVVETNINREVLDVIGRHNFAQWIPLGRVAQTDDMIGPALFLASDAARYVTGATLYADGAYSQNLVRYRPEP